MGLIKTLLATAAAAIAVTSMPASAGSAANDARQLRQLDMMLMVTNLRCRRLGADFTNEYSRFSSAHLTTMKGANQQLLATYGGNGSASQRTNNLDRMITAMANQYGLGHPWLECGELKQLAHDLSRERDYTRLLAAADEVLTPQRPSTLAFARAR